MNNILNEKIIDNIIKEEISKSEVNSMISSKINSMYDSHDFKKKVKSLAGDVVNELFKILWQRNNFWKTNATNV